MGKYDEAIQAHKGELSAPQLVSKREPQRSRKLTTQVAKVANKSASSRVSKRNRPGAKSKSPDYKQLAAWVPRDLFFEVKTIMASKQMEKELSEVVEEALRSWVRANH